MNLLLLLVIIIAAEKLFDSLSHKNRHGGRRYRSVVGEALLDPLSHIQLWERVGVRVLMGPDRIHR